jgi:hypothetical protein
MFWTVTSVLSFRPWTNSRVCQDVVCFPSHPTLHDRTDTFVLSFISSYLSQKGETRWLCIIITVETNYVFNNMTLGSHGRDFEYGSLLDCSAVLTGVSLPMFQTSVLPKLPGRWVSALMMEAVEISETLLDSYRSTGRYNREDNHLYTYLLFVEVAVVQLKKNRPVALITH